MDNIKFLWKTTWQAWLLLFILIFAYGCLIYSAHVTGKKECRIKYGQEWEYKYAHRGVDLCIDKEGNTKAL